MAIFTKESPISKPSLWVSMLVSGGAGVIASDPFTKSWKSKGTRPPPPIPPTSHKIKPYLTVSYPPYDPLNTPLIRPAIYFLENGPYRFSTMKISLSPGTPDLCTSNSHNPLPQNWGKLVKGKMTSLFWEGSDLISPHSYDNRKANMFIYGMKSEKKYGEKRVWKVDWSFLVGTCYLPHLIDFRCYLCCESSQSGAPSSTKMFKTFKIEVRFSIETTTKKNKIRIRQEPTTSKHHDNHLRFQFLCASTRVRDAIGDIFAHGQHDLLGVVQLLQQHGHLCSWKTSCC